MQETAEKIQEKCNAFSAALKTKKSADSNKTNTSNDNYKYKNHKNYKRSYKSNTFNDYTQRTYDFNKLEQALLGNACSEYESLLK
ncbi:hypothetical protein [Clostridium sp. KNHs214]|uniref:hypothetical protein n=1 Tax=Clostridium sp. KNHs214 TaxID=1540257 RepID=UPI00055500A0|nr:hypothetical protein [Clostridium sp. KNHs214]